MHVHTYWAVVHSAVKMSVPTQPVEGFYYDELSKIRALNPEIATRTQELKDDCKEFVDSKDFLILIKAHYGLT